MHCVTSNQICGGDARERGADEQKISPHVYVQREG